jgi:hypothetical protein
MGYDSEFLWLLENVMDSTMRVVPGDPNTGQWIDGYDRGVM